MTAITFEKDDGGREAAGFRGEAGDCATRAVAIATGLPYLDIYKRLAKHNGRTVRNGTPRKATDALMRELGWEWTPTMSIGSGCQVHLRADELPEGRLIVRVTRHWAAVVDGVLRDHARLLA